jgi:hypothetical protein
VGPKRLAPRGLAHSVQEALARLPDHLRQNVHVHAGTYTSYLKTMVQAWISGNKSSVAPTKRGVPQHVDLAILVPRPKDSPITLAYYLDSPVPCAVLVPNDLLQAAFSERIYPGANAEKLKAKFLAAGKLQMLTTQMTWVFGNVHEYRIIEMFPQILRTAAPITGDLTPSLESSTFDEPVPTTVEEWISDQNKDLKFLNQFSGLYLYAPDGIAPRILVPPDTREPLIRFTQQRMFHISHAKVAERLLHSYFWPSLRKDTRTTFNDCATCKIEKARQNLAHGLFRARPNEAPRTKYAMNFQGQGTATTSETEALAIIDTTARFVTVIALQNRQVQAFLQPFLDEIVFRHGPPAVLHCDEAPEFMSELMAALLGITKTTLTTMLGHSARSNGVIEVFWWYWNRCMRMLPDYQYRQSPRFVSRIVFAGLHTIRLRTRASVRYPPMRSIVGFRLATLFRAF